MAADTFGVFKRAVARQFDLMKAHALFRTEVEKELLWLTYLESFPPGTNPMFRERTEYDCQACKSFIRAVGSMVADIDGELVCLWDCELPEPFSVVAAELSELVKSAPIKNILLHEKEDVGVDCNWENEYGSDRESLRWEHFYIRLPAHCVAQFDRGGAYSEAQSTRDVFARALKGITNDALETAVELIDQGSLYRGEEHLHAVQHFAQLKTQYDALDKVPPVPNPKRPLGPSRQQELFTWQQGLHPAVSKIRNSAIGTLLVDLSEGKSLDEAVRMFEAKVAPQNYKRPKALATKSMIERARKTVGDLGYGPSLGRRFAVAQDVTVNNVLFANRDARKAMGADVFDEMISETKDAPQSLEKVEKVPIEKFVEDILPKAQAVELLLENRHGGNLVNLVAPVELGAKSLFKWDNGFSWAYNGDLADSIKERVKSRGGSVTGDFRASLAWFNADDLDLHLIEPNRNEIYYSKKFSHLSQGELDVDMNVTKDGKWFSRNAVENITYPSRTRMMPGEYLLFVENYTHREIRDVGFEVEVEFGGNTSVFSYDREVRQSQRIDVAHFVFDRSEGIRFTQTLPRSDVSREIWGLKTQSFHPVTIVMLSPNYWNGRPVGNKHWFFMLQDCVREGSSRGFFNEQLSDSLREHRKVFEILGSKMRTEAEGEQLSGLGFSSTKRNNVYAKIRGAFTRTVNIVF
ncbi:MAG: hypothetical protein ACYTCN_09345 [Planctomycetota bacterium]|jgi:hypothetical protein